MGNFHPLEVVCRDSETQLQVVEKLKIKVFNLALQGLTYILNTFKMQLIIIQT